MYKRLRNPGTPGQVRRIIAKICLITLTSMLLFACDDTHSDIRVYEVAKTTQHHGSGLLTPAAATQAPGQSSATAQDQSPLDLVQWTMPKTWHQENISRPMILAIFHVDHNHSLEVQVSAINGDAGGVLANVNRWRRQLGLPPISDEQLPLSVQIIDSQGSFGGVVDVTNPATHQRIVATIIQGGAGMSWFVKAQGHSDEVAAQKNNIITFAESFKFKSPPAQDPHQHPSPSTPDAASGPNPSSSMNAGLLPPANTNTSGVQIKTPANWTSVTPSSPIIQAAYTVSSPQGEAQVTVTSLSSDGGGLLPNINRWRNQLGLAPVADLADQPLALLNMPGVTAMLIDLKADSTGQNAGKRMFMAVVSRPNETWYFKMNGNVLALTQLKTDFITAVQSAQFAGAGQ